MVEGNFGNLFSGREASTSRPNNVNEDAHESKSKIDKIPSSQVRLFSLMIYKVKKRAKK